eukprot:12053135-Karenia_brevis.AAC.1
MSALLKTFCSAIASMSTGALHGRTSCGEESELLKSFASSAIASMSTDAWHGTTFCDEMSE